MTFKEAEPPTRIETPTLFLRNATGLVKGWSRFDAFLYSHFSVNFVTLGFFFSIAALPFIPQGEVIPALIVTVIFVSFLVFAYAALISVMPRAGGDYVWQSRILTPGLGFVLSVAGWWFILWYWTPVYANILDVEILQPIAAVFGGTAAVSWLSSDNGIFVTCIVTIALAALLVGLGMRGYARVQRFCFFLGGLALLIMFLIMLFTSRGTFISAFNAGAHDLFNAHGDVYHRTISVAAKGNGYVAPTHPGITPFFQHSMLLTPILCFWILWPTWGATLYGEVRGASDFRGVVRGMMSGLWSVFLIAIIFFFLAQRTFGWDFFNSANMNYESAVFGSTVAPTIPVWSYPPFLVSLLIPTAPLRAIFILAFGAWFLGWVGTLFLSSTRVIFAVAFDRILPERFSSVTSRHHVPVWGLLLMLVPAFVVSALYAYTNEFKTFVLDATLVIAITFFGSLVAAAILPWRKPDLFENSPVARYRLAGVPLVTVCAVLAAAFMGWNIYEWLTNSVYGVNNSTSLIFMGAMYLLAIVIYVVAKVWRRRQGLDLDVLYKEIPVE
ncbi:MAG TPA: APC family permease [Segeticoccus sp.]|uniref:APC family permease n=1 Tax=Segeticoccus sp. TaxID=2706531 RepID=UPI002D7E4567|nr:APC family permease [Segeticoccus sp.]HET8599796.1 APC family permease [Segeticoccus sp.]